MGLTEAGLRVAVDSANLDDAGQRLRHLLPLGCQVPAVPTPACSRLPQPAASLQLAVPSNLYAALTQHRCSSEAAGRG